VFMPICTVFAAFRTKLSPEAVAIAGAWPHPVPRAESFRSG